MNTLRRYVSSRWLSWAAIVVAFGLGALAQAKSASTELPIILVDRNAFFAESKAGQDVARQVQEMKQQIESDLNKKAEDLRLQEEQLMKQQSLLTQEAFESKATKLRDSRLALQREADQKGQALQMGVLQAQDKIWKTASPILASILKEKQAVLMIDRSAVVKGSVDLDVTAMALQRLNQELPAVKVELVSPQSQSSAAKAGASATPDKAQAGKPGQ
jgi:Skp family chaperone for outer membrane proteins